VTLYLFSLPFALVKELGWATVPIVTIVSFTFMGIEGIAEQIEMPFGTHSFFCFVLDLIHKFFQALMNAIFLWVRHTRQT
jgi:predicted membrane chloride channel (bestrophin family)